jgi:hypothetical protein
LNSSSSHFEIDFLCEGPTDSAVARRLIEAIGAVPGRDHFNPRKSGKSGVDLRVEGLNRQAIRYPVLVLRDMDSDAACPGALVASRLPSPAQKMCFRIAVRTVEAWLLADRHAFAAWIGVSPNRIPFRPEELNSPKRHIVDLARNSRKREIRAAMIPRTGSGVPFGPGFDGSLAAFATSIWDPTRAAKDGNCPSLSRALARLRALGGQ